MEPEYWRQRWAEGRIGFHRDEVNPRLRATLPELALEPGARVFVPLCGKSVDLAWLASRGLVAVGVEVSEPAVAAVFAEAGIEPQRAAGEGLDCWHGGGIEVHCGDFFALRPAAVAPLAAAWDRAALIALPPELRPRYVEHCARLLPAGARLLLVTMAYADAGVAGPPFSVQPEEVDSAYAPWFHVAALERDVAGDPPGDLASRGVRAIHESAWLLTRNEQPV